MNRKDLFFDSRNLYLDNETKQSINISKVHLDFCSARAGKKILDFGCSVGSYTKALNEKGFDCLGVDINPKYIEYAQKNNINAQLVSGRLPFEDNSFDTVTIIEVLEHLDDPLEVLKDAKRVARKNILITVPDCENIQKLKNVGLTFHHMLCEDHIGFYTRESLRNLTSKINPKNINMKRVEPIVPYALLPKPFLYYGVGALYKIGLLKPSIFTCLFCEIEL